MRSRCRRRKRPPPPPPLTSTTASPPPFIRAGAPPWGQYRARTTATASSARAPEMTDTGLLTDILPLSNIPAPLEVPPQQGHYANYGSSYAKADEPRTNHLQDDGDGLGHSR